MRAAGLEVISEILESEVQNASVLLTVGNNVANLSRINVTHELQKHHTRNWSLWSEDSICSCCFSVFMCYPTNLLWRKPGTDDLFRCVVYESYKVMIYLI